MSVARSALALCLLVVLLVPTAPALAQLSAFGLPHPFALPGATTARLFGMGGFVSCIPDDGFGNPAYAALVTDQQGVVRYSVTDFDGGMTLKGTQLSVATPVETGRKGLQVTAFRLDSEAGGVDMGSGPGPQATTNEWDFSVHWGQKADEDWIFGVALSPVFHSSLNVTLPVPGVPGGVSLLQTRSTRDWGYRLGALYRLGDRGWAGAIYDKYREHVTASGMALGGGAVRGDFSSDAKYLGVSYRLSDRLLGGLEWQQLSTEGASEWRGDSGLRCGLEMTLSERWTVRAGSNDGSLSAGLGYQAKGWSFRYAYLKDWNDDLVGALLGGSDTHQFEITTGW